MRPTRRGVAVIALVVLAGGLAALSGQRALNAVAAPLLAALLAGAVIVVRAPDPTVTYAPIQSGHPGQSRTLSIEVAGSGLVTVECALPTGLESERVRAVLTPPATLERPVALAERGVYRLDSPEVRHRDPLGLLERTIPTDATVEFVVYPRVHTLEASQITRLFSDQLAAERGEFDRLREYTPGDPLRDVHWKTSAKRDDFFVMEFAPPRRSGTVTVAADAAEGWADEMATAAATLATSALDLGLEVGLVLPDGELPADRGDGHRERLLRLLARAGPGSLPEAAHDAADVSITADGEGTRVRLTGRERTFDAVLGGADRPGEVTP